MTGIERLRNLIDDYRTGHECEGIECGELSCGECMAKNVLEPIADQIEREQDATVADSPYDALPPDERDAIAWVREHGGIAYVKDAWNVRSNLDRQLERAQAKVERQQRHIEFVQTKCRERQGRIMELRGLLHVEHDNALMLKTEIDWLREMLDAIADRLGLDARYADSTRYVKSQSAVLAAIARLVSDGEWPRFEDGETVLLGSVMADELGEAHEVTSIEFFEDGILLRWNPDEPEECVWIKPGERVQRPTPKVLDADGAEIRVGDTVWVTIDNPHGAPLLKGNEVTVRFVPHDIVHVEDKEGATWHVGSNDLTHERPDSWERLEEDARELKDDIGLHLGDYSPSDFKKLGDSIQDRVMALVRRAKALAERDA